MSKINMVYKAPISDGSGYSTNARNLLLGLVKSDKFNIKLENYLGSSIKANLSQEEINLFNSLIKNNVSKDKSVLIQVSVAAQFNPDYHKNIGYSVFETNRVPFTWVIPSNKMDAICVPCNQNKQAFIETGITKPVYVVPHGVTPNMNLNVNPLTMFSDKINFLFSGTPQYRKGLDIAISAYLNEFGDHEDTRLICKIYIETMGFDQELDRVKKMVKDARNKLGKHKGEIVIIPHYIDEERLYRLYASSAALLLCSRGEGWGFAGSEAAACGVPVIATNWSGPADYLNNDVAYMLDYEMVPVTNMQFNPQFMLAQMEGHMWAEPSEKQARYFMREIYKNPAAAKQKGLLASKHMQDNFSWESSSNKLIQVIEKVYNNNLVGV